MRAVPGARQVHGAARVRPQHLADRGVEPAGPGFRAAGPHVRMTHPEPGSMRVRGRWAQVPDNEYPLMINGVAVVSAPAEIDIVNAEQVRTVLREAGRLAHATVVADVTGTR